MQQLPPAKQLVVQELAVVVHAPHTGAPVAVGQELERICVIWPPWPEGQAWARVSVAGVQLDWGVGCVAQELDVVVHGPHVLDGHVRLRCSTICPT